MWKLLLTGVGSYLVAISTTNLLRAADVAEKKPIYVAPPKYITHMAFGYNGSLADTLWLRTVQDFDLCQLRENQEEVELVREVKQYDEITDHKMKFVLNFVAKANEGRKVCRKGWVFRMLDATTELDPRFRMPYEAGALGLSVIVDDYEGAKVMFDKALKQYPNDWEFLYRAAYHYLYDQKDLERAAELLSRAGDAGAPHWVKGLAATLYTTQGQLGLALATLEALKPGIKDPKILQNLDDRIQVLKEQAEIISRSESNKSSETP